MSKDLDKTYSEKRFDKRFNIAWKMYNTIITLLVVMILTYITLDSDDIMVRTLSISTILMTVYLHIIQMISEKIDELKKELLTNKTNKND